MGLRASVADTRSLASETWFEWHHEIVRKLRSPRGARGISEFLGDLEIDEPPDNVVGGFIGVILER